MAVILALLSVGCAGATPAPVLTPPVVHTDPIVHLGINWAYGPFPPAPLDQLASYHRNLLIRAAVRSLPEAQTILQNIAPYPDIAVLFLIERADMALVRDLSTLVHVPQVWAYECGNELDLAGLSAQAFADFVSGCSRILREAGFSGDVISGGIYTVTPDTLAYAAPMLAANNCGDVHFGIHLYGDSSDAILSQLQQAAGCHDIAITEFGIASRNPSEDAQQTAYLTEKLAAFQRLGARYAIIYQLASGVCGDLSNLGNFGLMRCDSSWKPASDLLK